ncbi:hypothetical protein [Pseudonocardia abyssalis]|jgi:hypothetical protein|uniref:DUF8175 domain-containing protein n=1 Tax=Pseudonocardia abyssalis TaxID=2792008 RepID=A0ABS6US57_9PSEU|nr:hypothetical protein [Pseudonocardia abyssalis]MBW0117193.1 hypothetical protein [Pseudonocardia abyssalis]MBW0135084.1 hypothetical protein [Pseudonocardia abyssalis]
MSLALAIADRRSRRRRHASAAAGLTTSLLVLGLALSLPTDQAEVVAPPDVVSLARVPGGVAAVSQRHGPMLTADGRAAGFTHDELGAAVAASNLAPRVSSAAGPAVYEATLMGQSWGDPAAMVARLRVELPTSDSAATGQATTARSLYYRIIAGDPRSDYVVVSLLAGTEQARSAGGLARVDLTLRWDDGDWRLRVPIPRPSLHPDTAGYVLLGELP